MKVNEAVVRLADRYGKGIFPFLLPYNIPYHTPILNPGRSAMLSGFESAFANGIAPQLPRLPIVTAGSQGQWVKQPMDADFFADGMLTVARDDLAIRMICEEYGGDSLVVEINCKPHRRHWLEPNGLTNVLSMTCVDGDLGEVEVVDGVMSRLIELGHLDAERVRELQWQTPPDNEETLSDLTEQERGVLLWR